jgi:hypothetical protein
MDESIIERRITNAKGERLGAKDVSMSYPSDHPMTSNSNEIRAVLLNILRIGVLRIRALASDGKAEQCFREADHLHNLPGLIQSLRPELLLYYYNIERVSFLKYARAIAGDFEAEWEKLAKLIGVTNPA